jgi:hypothetical protein
MSEAIPGSAISELTEDSLRAMLQRVYEQTQGNPLYDPKAMAELARKASQAWEPVPDAEAWLREVRGGTSTGGQPEL